MSGMKRMALVATLGLLCAGRAIAQDKPAAAPAGDAAKAAAPMAPPPPAKEMDALKPFLGTWKCTGEEMGPEPGKKHKVVADNTIKLDLGGYWQHVRHHELKTKDSPMEFIAEGWWGYDAVAKTYTGLFAGLYGAYETRTSPGWQGDTLVWSGTLHGFMGTAEAPFKHSFTKKSDTEVMEKFEIQMKGAWVTLQENNCKKK